MITRQIAALLYAGTTAAGVFALAVSSPQLLDRLFALAGLGWPSAAAGDFLQLPPANDVAPSIMLLAFLGEALLTLWLLSARRPPAKRR